MAFDPLPTPSSLVGPAVGIDSVLSQAESDLRQQTFVSTMSNIFVQANGTIELDLVTVDDAEYSIQSGWPMEMIKTVCQEALGYARSTSEEVMAALVGDASPLSLPGVPGVGEATPNWAGFAGAVDSLFAQADYIETRLSTMKFTGSSGPIVAEVNANLDLQKLDLQDDAMVETGAALGEYVRAAVNQALWNAKNLLDDYIHETIPPKPQPFSLPSVVLYASSVLKLGAGVQLKKADGNFASSANTGAAETSVGAGAQVGDIWSRAKVVLAEGAHVNGSVQTCDVVEEQSNVVVTGETKEHIFIDAPVLSLEVAFPGWSSGDVTVEADSDAGLDAGSSYGNVVINSGATLRMGTGVYYFQALTLDSGARLLLSGPVIIFVSGSIIFRGSVQTTSGARPTIAIGYTGDAMMSFQSRFDGVMVAPYAKVSLEAVAAPGYSGAFLAKEIEVAQGAVVTATPETPTGIPYDPPPPPPTQPTIDTPTGFVLTPGDKKVTLTWNAVAGATGYNVYYGTTPGLTTASTHLQVATTSYEHPNLINGTRYYFRVSAVGAAGESPLSVELSAVPHILVPGIPQNVTATPGDTKVTIAWSSVPTATGYNIYWATTPGVTKNSGKQGNKPSPFVHESRINGTTYYYRVAAFNAGGEGPLSAEVSATPNVAVPDCPTGVTATPGNAQVTIAWNAAARATSYKVYWATSPGVTKSSSQLPSVTATSCTHTPCTNGTTYYYRVSAVNAGGESALSTEVSATPQAFGVGILGFESATDWHTTSGTLTRVTSPKTQGAAAVQISGNGYAELTNTRPLTSNDLTVTSRFLVDLFIPTLQVNPYWMGQLQLFLTCPSRTIFHEFAGQKDLTGLSKGAYHTIEIAVPANLRTALQGSFSDLTLGIALNVDKGCGPHVFDNARFVP
jgi:fibronectin type 3 domain-containing protein